MRKNLLWLSGVTLALVAIFNLQSCKHDPEGIEKLDVMYYNTDIQPILSSCQSCHQHEAGGEFDLSTYPAVKEFVTSENPSKSKLYHVITGKQAGIMPPPPADPLSANSRTKIYLWIYKGALETNPSK